MTVRKNYFSNRTQTTMISLALRKLKHVLPLWSYQRATPLALFTSNQYLKSTWKHSRNFCFSHMWGLSFGSCKRVQRIIDVIRSSPFPIQLKKNIQHKLSTYQSDIWMCLCFKKQAASYFRFCQSFLKMLGSANGHFIWIFFTV